jgi:hypothetical protein
MNKFDPTDSTSDNRLVRVPMHIVSVRGRIRLDANGCGLRTLWVVGWTDCHICVTLIPVPFVASFVVVSLPSARILPMVNRSVKRLFADSP